MCCYWKTTSKKKYTGEVAMGAPRVTPTEIVKMIRLYKELGTYAAVGREIGRSASTVSKYVQMKGVPLNMKLAVENLMRE